MKSGTFKAFAVLLIFIGIIFGIVLGFACPVDVSDDWWTENLKFNVGLMFETWMVFDLLALFFGWLASVLEKLENIEQNICVESIPKDTSKPLTEYIQTAVNSIQSKLEKEPTENEWKCPKCGKINQNYVGTCGCGEIKPN